MQNKLVTLEGLKDYSEHIPFKKITSVVNSNITISDILPMNFNFREDTGHNNNILLSAAEGLETYDFYNSIIIGESNTIKTSVMSDSAVIVIGTNINTSNDHQVLLGNHNGTSLSDSVIFSCGDGTSSAFAVHQGDFINSSLGEKFYDSTGYSLQLGKQNQSIFANDKALVFQPQGKNSGIPYFMYHCLDVVIGDDNIISVKQFPKDSAFSKIIFTYDNAEKFFPIEKNNLALRRKADGTLTLERRTFYKKTTDNIVNPILMGDYENKKDIDLVGKWLTKNAIYTDYYSNNETVPVEIPAGAPIYTYINFNFDEQEIYGTTMSDYEYKEGSPHSLYDSIMQYPPSYTIGGEGASQYWLLQYAITSEEDVEGIVGLTGAQAKLLTFGMGDAKWLGSSPWI